MAIDSEPQNTTASEIDTIADEARELAIKENLTIDEAYCRLVGSEIEDEVRESK